jgi:hypothetical protein
MASQKISQFTPVTTLASGDFFPVVLSTDGTNKRADVGVLDNRYTSAASGVDLFLLSAAALPKAGGTMTGDIVFSGTQTFPGAGTVTNVTATSPLASTGGSTPDINIQDGTTAQKGAVQLEDSTSSTSTTKAATPNSVKAAYDLASAALPKAGGTMTGDITLNSQSDLRFADADSSNWVAFQAPATVASNVTWTLPAADGADAQMLSTNGSGTLSWAAAAERNKAWVNFDGTASPITIRASFNVSSISDNGTGDYTVNFTTALADANYAAVVTSNVATNIFAGFPTRTASLFAFTHRPVPPYTTASF